MATLLKKMFAIALIGVSSCKVSDKNSSLIFEELNEGLERSNVAINASTRSVLESLRQKTAEPATMERAEIWLAKAMLIFEASNSMKRFTDSLIESIERYVLTNSYPGKAAAAAAFEVLVNQKNGNRLFDSLNNYRKFLFEIDGNLEKVFRERSNYSDSFFLSKSKSPDEFTKKLFEQASAIQAICLLEKIKNAVLIIENELIVYCRNNVPSSFCGYYKFLPITFQNSKRFGPGDELEIGVGMGSFSLSGKPTIIINDSNVNPGEMGTAVFKMKVATKAGKYKVPVVIEYIMPDGTKSRLQKFIEYTVVE
jgi:hypothetical protein